MLISWTSLTFFASYKKNWRGRGKKVFDQFFLDHVRKKGWRLCERGEMEWERESGRGKRKKKGEGEEREKKGEGRGREGGKLVISIGGEKNVVRDETERLRVR
jgi:hypothetical protein